ncbi:MAG: ribonuclease HII [Candidatus Saccharimonadales bacterium]|jgi:ribonuclease HII
MVVGIDEVGRGCWAGPLVAGAVILDKPIPGLNDSKLLTKRQRSALSEQILTRAAAVGLGWVSSQEVDAFGLTAAVRLAMQRAVAQIEVVFEEIIIDGNYNFLADDVRARTIVRADAAVPAVSAASIVAKVARDNWMCTQAAKQFPVYGFDKHVGYGTKQHHDMLVKHGICPLHRQSYRPIQYVLHLIQKGG